MEIQRMFEQGFADGLFTDFDVCVKGSVEMHHSGGIHVSSGAKLFDISSLTKALMYLLFWKMFAQRDLDPESKFQKYLYVPRVGDRQIRDFMTYLVQGYGFDYRKLRTGEIGPCKKILLSDGFGEWERNFHYDNYSSIFLGFLLESYFKTGIEEILQTQLSISKIERNSFLFHPVYRGIRSPEVVVPTKKNPHVRGLVYDPLALAHQDEHIVSAGIFSTARTIAEIFHYHLESVRDSGFYEMASQDQLKRHGIQDHQWALGFDIPNTQSLKGYQIEKPLVFAGWTGCRVFFAKHPRVTIAITTNRVFCGGDCEVSRKKFSQFFWDIVHEVLHQV